MHFGVVTLIVAGTLVSQPSCAIYRGSGAWAQLENRSPKDCHAKSAPKQAGLVRLLAFLNIKSIHKRKGEFARFKVICDTPTFVLTLVEQSPIY